MISGTGDWLSKICKNCGKPRSEHVVIKYEGRVLNETPYICPTVVFEEKTVAAVAPKVDDKVAPKVDDKK